jgi:hypothetical protein
MVGVNISFDQGQVRAFNEQMKRAQVDLGKSEAQALKWGGVTLAKSLAGSTRSAPKLRKIVKNPSDGWRTDARKARFGVMRWLRGKEVFAPIHGTGEYGKYRYVDRRTLRVMQVDRAAGKRAPYEFSSNEEGAQHLAMAKHRKRIIGRRGLAKAAWRRALQGIGGGGSLGVSGSAATIARRAVKVAKRYTGRDKFIRVDNNLRYAGSAFVTDGEKAVSLAMARAADSMRFKIAQAITRKVFG